jgi:hypothetical protein
VDPRILGIDHLVENRRRALAACAEMRQRLAAWRAEDPCDGPECEQLAAVLADGEQLAAEYLREIESGRNWS